MDLGLEWAGAKTIWQYENDPWRWMLLQKRFPDSIVKLDIKDFDYDLPKPDLIASGFPCPPVSYAGKQKAQDDPRWLWPVVAEIIRSVRPSLVLLENTKGLLGSHGALGDVLGDLASIGYDAEWVCFGAADLGAPHRRDRVFIVAGTREHSRRWDEHGGLFGPGWYDAGRANRLRTAANIDTQGWDPWEGQVCRQTALVTNNWWSREPSVGRVAYRDTAGVDAVRRREALGDAVVPICATYVMSRIIELLP